MLLASQLSEQFNKPVVKRSIIDAIAIYAIVAVLGRFKDLLLSGLMSASKAAAQGLGFRSNVLADECAEANV